MQNVDNPAQPEDVPFANDPGVTWVRSVTEQTGVTQKHSGRIDGDPNNQYLDRDNKKGERNR